MFVFLVVGNPRLGTAEKTQATTTSCILQYFGNFSEVIIRDIPGEIDVISKSFTVKEFLDKRKP